MRVAVGRLGRPHGIRGEVTVDIRTDEPERRFAPGSVLFTEPERAPLIVESARWHGQILLLGLKGVVDRNGAELLRNTMLFVDVDETERPDEDDEFYDHQLIGMSVVLEDAAVVGSVSDVIHLPGQDLLAVTTSQGREVLVPFVTEIVPTVDVAARRITITPPEGLLSLNDEE